LTSCCYNFNDFPENELPKFQQIGMAPPYQISDWYGGRHICHTASGATGYIPYYGPQTFAPMQCTLAYLAPAILAKASFVLSP